MYLKSTEILITFILISEILHRIETKQDKDEKNNSNLTVNNSSLIPVETVSTIGFGNKNSTSKLLKKKRKKKRRKNKKSTTVPPLAGNENITSTSAGKQQQNKTESVDKIHKTKKKRNRCEKNNGGCAQICRPNSKRKCFCNLGFKQPKNHKKCIDINECRDNNNGGCQDICLNTLSSYYCACSPGLTLTDNLKSCRDINECLLRNGHGPCQGTCRDTHGSYTCDCSNLNGTRLGVDGHSCVDINECVEGSAGCSHNCINTFGGVFCSCPEGMVLSSDRKTCQDVNKCEDEITRKSCVFNNINATASSNFTEFQNDHQITSSKLIRCPKLFPPSAHGFIKCFREQTIKTKSGKSQRIFNRPGTVCKLICPTGFQHSGNYHVTCSRSGRWVGNRSGKCLEASKPFLKCPENLEIYVTNNEKMVEVSFQRPETNLKWDYVRANPQWAINLAGKLAEGYHVISFLATDRNTGLVSTCSFSITVKKQQN